MLVSKKHKALFLHNPKCAGVSFRHFLLTGKLPFQNAWDVDSTIPIYDRHWHSTRIPKWANDYFIFTTYRNPYARFVSEWTFRSQRKYTLLSFVDYLFSRSQTKHNYGLQVDYVRQATQAFHIKEVVKEIILPFGTFKVEKKNRTEHDEVSRYFNDPKIEDHFYTEYKADFVALGIERYDFTD